MPDDRLIAQMYRAASGLDAWSPVLDRIAETFDGVGMHIIGIDKPTGHISLSLHTSNASAADVGGHGRGFDVRNPHLALGADFPVGQVMNNHGRNGQRLVDTPFYRDYLMHYGYGHIIGGKICDDDDLIALLGLCRGPRHRAFSVAEERRLERLLTHFSNSMDLMRGTREWRARSDVGEALLGRSLRPSFLLRSGGRLVFANGAGREALEQACIVVNRQGVLAARDGQADEKLKCALCTLGVFGANSPGECPDRIALWLNDVSCGHRVPASLWAIRARTPSGAFGTETMGMLILANADPPRRVVPDPAVLASMFGFTPAESRIAAHLIAGAAPKQIAATLDLGMPTVRHHIRRLYTKCRCQDQRQLARRLSEALEVNGL